MVFFWAWRPKNKPFGRKFIKKISTLLFKTNWPCRYHNLLDENWTALVTFLIFWHLIMLSTLATSSNFQLKNVSEKQEKWSPKSSTITDWSSLHKDTCVKEESKFIWKIPFEQIITFGMLLLHYLQELLTHSFAQLTGDLF